MGLLFWNEITGCAPVNEYSILGYHMLVLGYIMMLLTIPMTLYGLYVTLKIIEDIAPGKFPLIKNPGGWLEW